MSLAASIRAGLSPQFTLDVRFSIAPGITMVFGASGSGKTTLLKCLAGLHRPDAGTITVDDRVMFDAGRGIDVPVRRRGLGFVFQHLALFPHMTVEQNLHYGLSSLDQAARRARTVSIAESFRIAHLLSRRPSEISGGERQRTALARSLVTDPRFLLLDEPLSALDHATQSRIIEDLRAWNAARDIPILYVTHSHREVFALGEHVLVLERGRILAEGSPQEVLDAPAHEPVALLAGFENILDATVVSGSADAGTMTCRLADGASEIEAPLTRAQPGARVRIAIRAGDILLSIREPDGLSARNVIDGTITSIQRKGATVIVMVRAACTFEVHVTPRAQEALRLTAGLRVWLVIKTHSCRIVSAPSMDQADA
jgi:molybdate transport system ATP-binding protein